MLLPPSIMFLFVCLISKQGPCQHSLILALCTFLQLPSGRPAARWQQPFERNHVMQASCRRCRKFLCRRWQSRRAQCSRWKRPGHTPAAVSGLRPRGLWSNSSTASSHNSTCLNSRHRPAPTARTALFLRLLARRTELARPRLYMDRAAH